MFQTFFFTDFNIFCIDEQSLIANFINIRRRGDKGTMQDTVSDHNDTQNPTRRVDLNIDEIGWCLAAHSVEADPTREQMIHSCHFS